MHKRQLQLLTLLLEATHSKNAIWRRDNIDSFQTKLAGLVCSIIYKYPLLTGEAESDSDAVRVTIGTLKMTFYRGSEGYNLVEEIVAGADPEIEAGDQRVLLQLDDLIKRLKRKTPNEA